MRKTARLPKGGKKGKHNYPRVKSLDDHPNGLGVRMIRVFANT